MDIKIISVNYIDRKTILFCILILILMLSKSYESYSQGSRKVTSEKYQNYIDSLKTMDYKQLFPIWGNGAYKKGFDIPYPYGAMVNFYMQEADISITNLEVGFITPNREIGPIPLDSIVVFDVSNSKSFATSFRPDIWLFPFLNVYGLFSVGKNSTSIKLAQPVPIEAVTDFNATGYGFGFLVAGGFGPGWITMDNNWIWTHIPALKDPVKVQNMSFRFGVTKQNERNPERNYAVWVGAFRQKIASETKGSISVNELFPDVDDALADRIENGWDEYLDGKNCGGAIEHPACKLDPLVQDIVDKLRTNEPISQTEIFYSMDKSPVKEWNLIVGGQYQFNKKWQLRSEVGFLGTRTQFLLSMNYRFIL